MQQHIESEITTALVRLSDHYGIPTPTPTILWNLTGKSCLGQAVGHRTIRLHSEAARLVGEAYVKTALHEAAHVAVSALKFHRGIVSREGRWSAHGAEWKAAMRLLGLTPNRCGTLPPGVTLTPARTVQRHTVACACRTHEITSVRLNKGLGRYKCKACGSGLRLV